MHEFRITHCYSLCTCKKCTLVQGVHFEEEDRNIWGFFFGITVKQENSNKEGSNLETDCSVISSCDYDLKYEQTAAEISKMRVHARMS